MKELINDFQNGCVDAIKQIICFISITLTFVFVGSTIIFSFTHYPSVTLFLLFFIPFSVSIGRQKRLKQLNNTHES